MKKIAIDMDGVLANVFEQFVKYDAAETGIIKTIRDAIGKGEHEPFPNADKYLHTPGFFRQLPVMPGSKEVMKELNKNYEVFIVSAATEFPQCLTEKQAWLNERFPFIGWQQMVFCGIKTIIKADIMIDDNFRNLDPFEGKTILFNQPHTQLINPGRHTRVFSWYDVEDLLLKKVEFDHSRDLNKTA